MRYVLVAAAAACGFSSITSAHIVTLLQDIREVRAQANVSSPNGTDADGPNTNGPTMFGAPFDGGALASAVVAGAAAGASTVQGSEIGVDFIHAQGSVSLSSSVGPDGMGSASGHSILDLTFTVAPGDSIELVASQSGVGVIELRGANDEFLFVGSGVFTYFNATRLRLVARAEASLSTPPSGSTGGGYSIILNVVPAPSAALLLAATPLMALRRRR